MHPDAFPKQVVSPTVKGVVMKAVDVGDQFKNEQEFESCDHMLQWICTTYALMNLYGGLQAGI